jgi:Bacterial Ig domain
MHWRKRPELASIDLDCPRLRRKGDRRMKSFYTASTILLACACLLGSLATAQATISITAASGGSAMSADTAGIGGSGAWTTLGPITIIEGKNSDISAGSGVTLILKAPSGFEFNPASTPSISFASGQDITSANVAVTDPSTLTITLNVSGTSGADTLIIGAAGLQVRPTLGGPLAANRHIYRPSSGGGTAGLNGVTTSADGSSGSNFGSLAEVPGNFVKLQLLTPGETGSPGSPPGKTGLPNPQVAGTAFNVVVNGVDANWNIVPSASGSSFTIHLASSDPNAAIPADADLASGTRTFSVASKTAGSATLTASDLDNGDILSATSPAITVNPGAFSKLQVLIPGESAAPGTASGKTGSATSQTAGTPFSVTVNAADANWNLISTNDTVSISSSDTNATLPPNAPLSAGSAIFNVTLKTAGSRTVTASDVTHVGISAGTSASIPLATTAFAKLQLLLPGESAAPGSASGKTGSPFPFTAGTPVQATVNGVDQFWNVLNTATDTVAIAYTDLATTLPPNAGLVNGTNSFSLTPHASGNQTVTASDVSDGTKTSASDNVFVNPGPATQLVILTQPSASASAGVALAQQPKILIEDALSNIRSNDALVVSASINSGTGLSLGTTNITSVNGVATFTNLACAGAATNTIRFSSGALTPAISDAIVVSAGPFNRLVALLPGESAAPGTTTGRTGTPTATAGGLTPVRVNATDLWFNPVNSITHTIALSATDTNAVLPPNTALSNGTNTLNITFKTAGTQTVTASDVTDGSKTSNSDTVTVAPGPFAKLQLLVPGEFAAPGTVAGKLGAASNRVATVAFNVIVNGVDANWNVVPSANGASFTIQLTSSDPNAVLPANADLASGTQTFAVTLRTAGSATITATDVDDGTKTPSTSPVLTVNAGPFSQLQTLLPGETAVAGSSTGKSGAPITQTAGVPFNVTVKAVDAAWNPRSTNDTVHITSSDANATLPPDAPLVNGVGTVSVTLKTGGNRTVTAADTTRAGIGTNTSSAVTVAPGAYARLQVLMPGEIAAPGTVSGKTGTPTARIAGTAFSTLSVGAVDAFWNTIATNATVRITSSDTNATLPANSALGATGLKTNFSLTFKTAGTQTVTATDINDASKTNTSSLTTVTAGAFAKLQLLVPGETPAPGSTNGKIGTPAVEFSNVPFNVTVNGVDANWNLINTNDTIRIASSDPAAILPPNGALVSGTRNFTVTLVTPGANLTVSASNVTHTAIAANTSPLMTVLVQTLRGGPVVAIHDSEYTRALENIAAAATTPSGPGTTGKEWWPTNFHYFVMPEALKEALRSDGIPFEVLGDADIINGRLMDTNGRPKYPILFSLASEAVADNEIPQISSYVAAGGFVFAGSSAFTRNINGTTRGDFAFTNEMGLHMVTPALTNWRASGMFTKVLDDRLISHIPSGTLYWEMPVGAEETSWGAYPHPSNPYPNGLAWQVQPSSARLLANGAVSPFLTENAFGKGHFIYEASMEPIIGHGGWASSMYAYVIFRKAIEWAFENARMPLPRLSAWPYPYDAAFMARHDLENYQSEIASVEASAQIEFTNGVKGDYFFCTGTLREEMFTSYDTNLIVASLRRAVSNYQATIGPHNGGLRNPYNNPALSTNSFDFWHWGPDEALDVTPAGWSSGKAYASASVSNSFLDIERWLPGLMTNGMRVWAAPYFDATRENSYDIQAQLGVRVAGEQKLTPLPHWVVSTATSGKRYALLSLPVSDWYIGNTIGQAMEVGHTTNSVHALVDFYYGLGGLINLYCHTLTTGNGGAGLLPLEYISYCLNTNLHPRLWSANSIGIYNWWLQRSNAQISVSYFATNGDQAVLSYAISGAADTNTAVEALIPGPGSYSSLQVLTNGTVASGNAYRLNGQTVKIRAGISVTNAEIRYSLGPTAQPDIFTSSSHIVTVPPPGVLVNDIAGAGGANLLAILVTAPANGSVSLSTNGGFTYTQGATFAGSDTFTYKVNDGIQDSLPATVTVSALIPPSFSDNFSRATDPGPIAPWLLQAGQWTVTGGELRGGTNSLQTYANVYLTNTWSDYAVQARLRFPAGAFGGGLGGRLDPVSGTHYAAWIYPENSPGGSNVFRLIKFSNWTTWSPLAQVSLASVGTVFHTVKLAFQARQISAFVDGAELVSVADNTPPVFTSGGVSLDMWTDLVGYVLEVDDVLVAPLVSDDSYTVNQNSVLNVAAPGVLANDTDVYGTALSAVPVANPSRGALTLNANGSFMYTPALGFFGTDSFIYQANDGPTNLGTARVTITVVNPNPPPVILSISLSNLVTTLKWSSVPGRTYRLQYKTNLLDANWTAVTPNIVATGSVVTATNPVGTTSRRFYNVLLLP